MARGRPSSSIVPASRRSAPKTRRARPFRPGPARAGQPEYLAGVNRERDVAHLRSTAESTDPQPGAPDLTLALRELAFERAADHPFDQSIAGHITSRCRGDMPAVAQYGHAVGDREN